MSANFAQDFRPFKHEYIDTETCRKIDLEVWEGGLVPRVAWWGPPVALVGPRPAGGGLGPLVVVLAVHPELVF